MIKKVVGNLLILLFVGYCVNNGLAAYKAKVAYAARLETRTFYPIVHKNDCMDIILEKYFCEKNEGMSWMEWRSIQHGYNKHLTANGRSLQPGDRLTVVCKVLVHE